jgi:hypothetical protein
VFESHFGVLPRLDLSGPGSSYVIPDLRVCANGSLLISLLNANVASANVTLRAPPLLAGLTVENLTRGGMEAIDSDGEDTKCK